ncbi:MAG: diacylglycerol kinase family protein [Myxococcales bacterium]|nr:diacylglycerol kinase family protein [Myxococcales bacterium]
MSDSPPTRPPRAPIRSGFLLSFRYATTGLLHSLATDRNLKIHWTSGLMVAFVGMALPLDLTSRAALIFSVMLVIFAEILNTALESFVDLHIHQYHRHAMIAKDAAAAGVLILALAVVAVFIDILIANWSTVTASGPAIRRSLLFGLPATALLITLLAAPLPRWTRAILGTAILGLLVPLVGHSQNHVFSGMALFFATIASWARLRFYGDGRDEPFDEPEKSP